MSSSNPRLPRSPSWTAPILFGALHALVGLLLLVSLLLPAAVGEIGVPGFCCCVAFVVPFGILPASMARRREPGLSPGQGFAVSFMAVGAGSVLWAIPTILSAKLPDERAVRQSLVAMQEDLPPEQRYDPEQLDQLVQFVVNVAPYLPAILATATTLFAGFVGMVTIARRRRRPLPVETAPPAPPDPPVSPV